MATLAKVVPDPLTNHAYGFPMRGGKRRVKPVVLACIHITDNAKNQGPKAATNERNFANRAGSDGPSAHFYINRNGGGVKAIDWVSFAAWSNGDVNKPRATNKGIQRMLALQHKGFNPNEAFAVEIENVGFAKVGGQMTPEQIRRCARIIARASIQFGLPINRNTVLAHADVDSVNRADCPALPKLREPLLADIIRRAKRRKAFLLKHP